MALKKVYIGSVGPFLYDDADLVGDPDGDFSGASMQGILTDGGLQSAKVPTDPNDAVRKTDIDSGGWVSSKTLAAGNVTIDVGADLDDRQIEQLTVTGDVAGSTLVGILNGSAGQIVILEFVDANVTLEYSGTKAGGTLYLDNAGADMPSNDEAVIGLICVGGNYWKELFSSYWTGL